MKHITLKLSIFSMILLSTFLWSCKEEPLAKVGNDINYTTSTTFSNPYDSVGVEHNNLLAYYHNNNLPHDSTHLMLYNFEGDFFATVGDLDNYLEIMGDYYIVNNIYSESQVDSQRENIKDFFMEVGLFSELNDTLVLNFLFDHVDDIFDEAFVMNYIDSINYSILSPMINDYKNLDLISFNNRIENFPWDTLNTSVYSNALKFEAVYRKSKEYWYPNGFETKAASLLMAPNYEALDQANEAIAVLGADALGTVLGGFGAAVTSGIMILGIATSNSEGDEDPVWPCYCVQCKQPVPCE